MSVINIMPVGGCSVGKSTIGNFLVEGNPTGPFGTNDECIYTWDPKWVTGSDCSYCDVPGIPEVLSPKKTKESYDILVNEARKEINVILFVFEYVKRFNFDVFSKGKMLFRELKKSKAMKVLLINDKHNYFYGDNATEDDYRKMSESIKDCMGLSFSHVLSMTGPTIESSLANLKVLLRETVPRASPSLKTYDELKAYVEELNEKQNYKQIAYEEEMAKISQLEMELNELGADATKSNEITTGKNLASFLPFGTTTVLANSQEAILAMKKKELEDAKERVTKDKIEETARLLKEACESFDEFDKR